MISTYCGIFDTDIYRLIVTAAMVLYLALRGYDLVRAGQYIQAGEFYRKIFYALLIYTLIIDSSTFTTLVANPILNAPYEVAQIFLQGQSIVEKFEPLNNSLGGLIAVIATAGVILVAILIWNPLLMLKIIWGIFSASFSFMIQVGRTIAFAVAGLMFLVMLGPIFLGFLLFDSTKYLFTEWLKFVFNYALQPIIIILLMIMFLSGMEASFQNVSHSMEQIAGGTTYKTVVEFAKPKYSAESDIFKSEKRQQKDKEEVTKEMQDKFKELVKKHEKDLNRANNNACKKPFLRKTRARMDIYYRCIGEADRRAVIDLKQIAKEKNYDLYTTMVSAQVNENTGETETIGDQLNRGATYLISSIQAIVISIVQLWIFVYLLTSLVSSVPSLITDVAGYARGTQLASSSGGGKDKPFVETGEDYEDFAAPAHATGLFNQKGSRGSALARALSDGSAFRRSFWQKGLVPRTRASGSKSYNDLRMQKIREKRAKYYNKLAKNPIYSLLSLQKNPSSREDWITYARKINPNLSKEEAENLMIKKQAQLEKRSRSIKARNQFNFLQAELAELKRQEEYYKDTNAKEDLQREENAKQETRYNQESLSSQFVSDSKEGLKNANKKLASDMEEAKTKREEQFQHEQKVASNEEYIKGLESPSSGVITDEFIADEAQKSFENKIERDMHAAHANSELTKSEEDIRMQEEYEKQKRKAKEEKQKLDDQYAAARQQKEAEIKRKQKEEEERRKRQEEEEKRRRSEEEE